MSEIFYSQVDKALQLELDARAKAGKSDRSTRALNYMLGKIANVEILAYEDDTRVKTIGNIGGADVRSGNYLPSGFLKPMNVEVQNNQIDFSATDYVNKTTDRYIDSAKRTPPIITSADITIGDHSMGLLNKATINIVIPNPDRDLNWFESIWMRPGRVARIKFVHPESAVITGDKLLDESLPSYETIKSRYPKLEKPEYNEFKKLNQIVFDGLITSFSLDYQLDGSIQVTLSLTGTSNIYTDVTLLINTDKTPSDKTPIQTDVANIQIDNNKNDKTNGTSANENVSDTRPTNYIFTELIETIDRVVLGDDAKNEEIKKVGKQVLESLEVVSGDQERTNDHWALYGKPYETGSADYSRYVTLGYLVSFINEYILDKLQPEQTIPTIICDSSVIFSTYYSKIVSSNPDRILLMSANSSNGSATNYYGPEDVNAIGSIVYYKNINEPRISFNDGVNSKAYPAKIFINMEVIRSITDGLIAKGNEFTVSNLFQQISSEIKACTGNAVDMKLISHPDRPDALLFYDANYVKTPSTNGTVNPYAIPMFANDERGTIVRDFKFSTQLPDNVKNLSYVLNQDPDKVSEQDIAPYINFMYQSNTIIREWTATGIKDTINPNADKDAANLAKKYLDTHEKYITQLTNAKAEFAKAPTYDTHIMALQNALKKYVQYPAKSIHDTNMITAPIFPFDVEFTIDGINGFRYGDVLQFNGLPERYRRNTVFSVISVTHTVSTSGEWTTAIRCIMRPKIGK